MKHNPSLEDKKRALLEQIHSSRETYRRMLTQSDTRHTQSGTGSGAATFGSGQSRSFPRSMTMKWIAGHPYMSAAALVAVALLGTRPARTVITQRAGEAKRRLQGKTAYLRRTISNEVSGTHRTARTRSTDFAPAGQTSKSMAIARSAFTALATTAAMLLRDPAKMRAAGNAFSTAREFVRSRRARNADTHHAQLVRVKER